VRRELFLAEIDLDLLLEQTQASAPMFKALPVFPPVRRDMTLISPPNMTCAVVMDAIQDQAVEHLAQVVLVDRFEPQAPSQTSHSRQSSQSPQDVHLTLRLTYRHPERSLTNEEVDAMHHSLSTRLQERLPIRFS